MAGALSGGFVQGKPVFDNQRQNYIGAYIQDTWKVNSRLTLNGVGGQRAVQLLTDAYDANPTVDHYLNRAAFGSPTAGTYSSLGAFTILNPSSLQIDTGLSRTFRVVEGQTIQFRWETFNVPNRLNANAPVTALNNANFGKILSAQDPRIMQFALKYVF